jgi:hypothetical protein
MWRFLERHGFLRREAPNLTQSETEIWGPWLSCSRRTWKIRIPVPGASSSQREDQHHTTPGLKDMGTSWDQSPVHRSPQPAQLRPRNPAPTTHQHAPACRASQEIFSFPAASHFCPLPVGPSHQRRRALLVNFFPSKK